MDEKEETKEEKPKEEPKPTENSGEGDKPKTTTLIDDTNLAAKRMEEATKAAREERLAAEDSYAKMKFGGTTEAGSEQAPKFTEEQLASRKRIKAVADASGASWGKNYE